MEFGAGAGRGRSTCVGKIRCSTRGVADIEWGNEGVSLGSCSEAGSDARRIRGSRGVVRQGVSDDG